MAKDIKTKVQEYFELNPLADKVYTTSDGFLFSQKQFAINHGATLDKKEVISHKRTLKSESTKVESNEDKADEPKDLLELSIDGLKEALKEINEVELIEALLTREQNGNARKGAIEVLESRLKELSEV